MRETELDEAEKGIERELAKEAVKLRAPSFAGASDLGPFEK